MLAGLDVGHVVNSCKDEIIQLVRANLPVSVEVCAR